MQAPPRVSKSLPSLRTAITLLVILLGIFPLVALFPSATEDTLGPITQVEPDLITRNDQLAQAPGIPRATIPDYSIDGFKYISVQGKKKQWKIASDQAFMYQKIKLVHARTVHAELFNPDDSATLVSSQEAKYNLDSKVLEMFGNVKTVLPDGFTVYSAYMRYMPKERRILIPENWFVAGEGRDDGDPNKKLFFESYGMVYDMEYRIVHLLTKSKVTVVQDKPDKKNKGVREKTVIESDESRIEREKKVAHFMMFANRPDSERFVRITQPQLYAQARRADFNYGDYSKLLNYLVAYEDVLIKERETGPVTKYATGGRADFDTKRDLIILREYPQVYQDNDTVTGDIIYMHRDTDIVEVEHSNAFSEGGQK